MAARGSTADSSTGKRFVSAIRRRLDGWLENELGDFGKMPFLENPARGYVATANNRPEVECELFLGEDWLRKLSG